VTADPTTALVERLRQARVQIAAWDDQSVWLRGVPAHPDFFNKAATNLLVKRTGRSGPFAVCVDANLEYRGTDARLQQAFAQAPLQSGWRVLMVRAARVRDAVEHALDVVGFERRTPTMADGGSADSAPPAVLKRFGDELTPGALEPCVGRDAEIDRVLRAMSRARRVMPVIAGASGIGKTNLLHGLSRQLLERHPNVTVTRIDLGVLFAGTWLDADREQTLTSLFDELAADHRQVVALEQIELLFDEAPHGWALAARSLESGGRLIGLTSDRRAGALFPARFVRHVDVVALNELPLASVGAAIDLWRPRIADHHELSIDPALTDAVIDAACDIDGLWPVKAIVLLDSAAAAASHANRRAVSIDDVHAAHAAVQRRSRSAK
jgi:ATP-dependent Clp protease ATP-binding subunit ClpA